MLVWVNKLDLRVSCAYIDLPYDVSLVARRQVGVDRWEQLDSRQLGYVSLSIHESLHHLDDLLLKIFHVDQSHDTLDRCDSLKMG